MTIKEVAALAGVSPAAVSRYMNGGSISEEKRERIRAVIERTGYRPNPAAQTMRTGRCDEIGVIVPKIDSDSVSAIVAGISEGLKDKNYMVVLGSTAGVREEEIRYLSAMQSSNVAGIILMGTVMTPFLKDAIAASEKPVVVTGQNFEGVPSVFHDDYNAVKELMNRMIARGRRKIVYIGVLEEDLAAGAARHNGAVAAWKDAGFTQSLPCEIATFDTDGGVRCMENLLKKHPDLDGVVCATDRIALGAMQYLQSAGRKVPEDVSVAGVGDSWAGRLSAPPLTTAHLYFRQCGAAAVDMLLQKINAAEDQVYTTSPIQQIMLEYTIVERGSI